MIEGTGSDGVEYVEYESGKFAMCIFIKGGD